MNPLHTTNTDRKPVFKLGLPGRNVRNLPQLSKTSMPIREFRSENGTWSLPGPNIAFTPIPDNRELFLEKLRREQAIALESRKNPNKIERR